MNNTIQERYNRLRSKQIEERERRKARTKRIQISEYSNIDMSKQLRRTECDRLILDMLWEYKYGSWGMKRTLNALNDLIDRMIVDKPNK